MSKRMVPSQFQYTKAEQEARRLAEIEARAEAAETELEAKRRERKERKAAAKEEARLKKELKRAH